MLLVSFFETFAQFFTKTQGLSCRTCFLFLLRRFISKNSRAMQKREHPKMFPFNKILIKFWF